MGVEGRVVKTAPLPASEKEKMTGHKFKTLSHNTSSATDSSTDRSLCYERLVNGSVHPVTKIWFHEEDVADLQGPCRNTPQRRTARTEPYIPRSAYRLGRPDRVSSPN